MGRYTLTSLVLSIAFGLVVYTSVTDGYVIKKFADFEAFPRLTLLKSIDEISPVPLVVVEGDESSEAAKGKQSKRYVPTDEELTAALERIRNSESNRQMSQMYAKKSYYTGYKSTKVYNNSGSRNCFFSPVQCLVQFDLSKYKKMADASGMRRFRSSEQY